MSVVAGSRMWGLSWGLSWGLVGAASFWLQVFGCNSVIGVIGVIG